MKTHGGVEVYKSTQQENWLYELCFETLGNTNVLSFMLSAAEITSRAQ
jgi:hypothetical protein